MEDNTSASLPPSLPPCCSHGRVTPFHTAVCSQVIAVLCNPAERLWKQWWHDLRHYHPQKCRDATTNLATAREMFDSHIKSNMHDFADIPANPIARGLYGRHLESWVSSRPLTGGRLLSFLLTRTGLPMSSFVLSRRNRISRQLSTASGIRMRRIFTTWPVCLTRTWHAFFAHRQMVLCVEMPVGLLAVHYWLLAGSRIWERKRDGRGFRGP